MGIEVLPRDGKWAIERDGNQEGELYSSQEEAVEAARLLAGVQNADVLVHDKDVFYKDVHGHTDS